jgi:hypothetical protein
LQRCRWAGPARVCLSPDAIPVRRSVPGRQPGGGRWGRCQRPDYVLSVGLFSLPRCPFRPLPVRGPQASLLPAIVENSEPYQTHADAEALIAARGYAAAGGPRGERHPDTLSPLPRLTQIHAIKGNYAEAEFSAGACWRSALTKGARTRGLNQASPSSCGF